MSALRVLAPIAFVVVVMSLLVAGGLSGRVSSLELIQVLDIAPRDVEVGDRMAIAGTGFPPGKQARLTFRGSLYRPGERPQRGIVVETTGIVVTPQHVDLEVDDPLQALFCREGDRAVHTTFEGDLEVAFAAAAPGAAPVSGVLDQITLDLRPSAKPSDADGEAEGARFLAFIGIHGTSGTRDAGVLVRDVAAGSAAEVAGLAAGDVLVRFDGVRVATMSDVVPVEGEREAEIGIRRRGSDEMRRKVAFRGFRSTPARELLGPWLAVLTALLIVLFLAAPAPAPVARAVERVVTHVRSQVASRETSASLWGMLSSIAEAGASALPAPGAAAMVDLAACACLAVMPFGQYPALAKMDVGILFVGAATALAAAGAMSAMSARSMRQAGAVALHVLWQHVPGAIAVATAVQTTGSLCIREVERVQGGWPWDWLAFRSPASLLATLLLIQCARIEPMLLLRSRAPGSPTPPVSLERQGGRCRPAGRCPTPPAGEVASATAWLAAIARGHRLVMAGLVAALFLGGWSLPGLTPAQQDSRPVLEAVGAAVYLAKLAVMAFAIGAWRWMAPVGTHRDETGKTAVALIPLAVACFVASAVYNGWGPSAAVQLVASASLVVASLFVAVGFGRRLLLGLTSGTPDAHLSPFL